MLVMDQKDALVTDKALKYFLQNFYKLSIDWLLKTLQFLGFELHNMDWVTQYGLRKFLFLGTKKNNETFE